MLSLDLPPFIGWVIAGLLSLSVVMAIRLIVRETGRAIDIRDYIEVEWQTISNENAPRYPEMPRGATGIF